MTPEEAEEKWCPFARVALANKVDGDGAFYFDGRMAPITAFNRLTSPGNNTGTLPQQSCCIADKCMAWRWTKNYEVTDYDGLEETTPTKGYCGLAGQP